MKRVLTYLLAWIALAACIAVLVGSLNMPRFITLAADSVETHGTVVSLEPSNHQTVHYAYQVGGVAYAGAGPAGDGNPGFASLRVGDRVLLHYARTAPAVSALGRRGAHFANELITVVLAAFVLPAFLVGAYWVKRNGAKR